MLERVVTIAAWAISKDTVWLYDFVSALKKGSFGMMYSKLRFIGSLALASALLSSAASASTVLVTISDSLSGTVQSISDSISRASKSSSNAVNVAEGDYRIVDVAMKMAIFAD